MGGAEREWERYAPYERAKGKERTYKEEGRKEGGKDMSKAVDERKRKLMKV